MRSLGRRGGREGGTGDERGAAVSDPESPPRDDPADDKVEPISRSDKPFSTAEYHRFCADFGVALQCELCSQVVWYSNVPEGAMHMLEALYTASDGKIDQAKSKYLPVLTMFCGNCGNVRSHAAGHVREWRRSLPDA